MDPYNEGTLPMDVSGSVLPCPWCTQPLTTEVNFCSRCGKPVNRTASPNAPAAPKWYYNVWFVLVMLFFVLGPFGLPLVWKNPRFSRWVKIALTVAMVLYSVVLIEMTLRMVQTVMREVQQFNSTLSF